MNVGILPNVFSSWYLPQSCTQCFTSIWRSDIKMQTILFQNCNRMDGHSLIQVRVSNSNVVTEYAFKDRWSRGPRALLCACKLQCPYWLYVHFFTNLHKKPSYQNRWVYFNWLKSVTRWRIHIYIYIYIYIYMHIDMYACIYIYIYIYIPYAMILQCSTLKRKGIWCD